MANAALIGSLAPFLVVPLGAWLFREYIDPRALVFAVIAVGGLVLVLFSAPPLGDASLEGNVLGAAAMLLLVGYVVSTKHFRRRMDVTPVHGDDLSHCDRRPASAGHRQR